MSVNVLNRKNVNDYLTDIVYRGHKRENIRPEDFKNVNFIQEHKDAVICSMVMQWCKDRFNLYLTGCSPENSGYLVYVNAQEPDLPKWAENAFTNNEKICRFEANSVSPDINRSMSLICEYLYVVAQKYVDKNLRRIANINPKAQNAAPIRLHIDFLKSYEVYNTLENTLIEARKWQKIMHEKTLLQNRNKKMYQASLNGTKRVMKLTNGMEIVELTSADALKYEGEYMGHCVGSSGYYEAISKGEIKVYSLRDANDLPHVTFTICPNEKTKKDEITACLGKENKVPIAKYRAYIRKFIAAKKLEVNGLQNTTGLIKLYDEETKQSQYYDVFDIPHDRKFVCKGSVCLAGMKLTKLPDLSNVIVEGNFSCAENLLTSLKGRPAKVGGYFDCEYNKLESLQEIPPCTEFLCDRVLRKKYELKNYGMIDYHKLTTNKVYLKEKKSSTQHIALTRKGRSLSD